MSFLGLDGGGSATRWAVCDAAGAIRAAGEVGAISGHLFNATERGRLAAVCAELAAAVAPGIARVVAGITGLSSASPEASHAAAMIAGAFGLPVDAVQVRDDMWIAYHAVYRPGAGHVVYAGTGSIGMHIRADGTVVRVGGRGMLIDDGGSAFWIGREALQLVWRRLDADPDAAGPLARALAEAIGGADWDRVRSHIYGGGRNAVALLARVVAAADDDDARVILRRAGSELARLALALVGREGSRPVALIGRAARLHPAIAAGFRTAAPCLDMCLAAPDAAAAAARLAVGADAVQAVNLEQS